MEISVSHFEILWACITLLKVTEGLRFESLPCFKSYPYVICIILYILKYMNCKILFQKYFRENNDHIYTYTMSQEKATSLI